MASLSDHSRARSPFLFVPSQLSSQAPNARVNTSPVPVQAHNENIDASRLGRYAAQLHVPPLSTKPTWQSKSPKITFGSANASILAPSPNPNPSLNQAQWPPRPPLQPKAESSLPTETYLDKVRIAEALIARDVAVEKLEAVCASVRDKQLKIDNLERERDRLKEELNGITSSVPAIGHHEEGKEGNVWAKQREKFLDEINTLEQSNQTLKNENENLRKTCLFDQDDALGERAHSKNFPFIEEDSDKSVDIKSPVSGASSPLLPLASLTLSDSQPKQSGDDDTSSRDNERYAVLSELPIPPDMPSDVLAPIIIPAPFTIHDFLGTITGPLKAQLSNYRIFQECTTSWCPEREEHGYYLTPAFKCVTNPRVSTAHRWVSVDLDANFGKPMECFFNKEGKWYYAGVYKSFKINELSNYEWEKLSNEATQIIIKETLASRKNTSPQNIYETNQLYTIGALKVVCVALQCVGFDEALYTEVLEKAEACKKSGRWRVVGAGVGQVGGVWSVGVNPSQNLVGLGSHTASGVGGTKSPIVESPVIKDGEDAVTSPSVTLAHGIPLGGPVVEKMAKGI